MINLPRKKDEDVLKREEELKEKREAFISQAPLKEGTSLEEGKPAFQNFKIPKEKKKAPFKPRKKPEAMQSKKIATYLTREMYEDLKAEAEDLGMTEASLFRMILKEHINRRKWK